jgi:hypothetical protein
MISGKVPGDREGPGPTRKDLSPTRRGPGSTRRGPGLQAGDKFRAAIQFRVAVVKAGDHERGKFQANPVTAGGADEIQRRFQVSPQDLPVVCFRKTFKVDIGGVDKGQNLPGLFQVKAAVAYQNVGNALFMGQFHTVLQVLNVDKGFRIRVGDLPRFGLRRNRGYYLFGLHPAARRPVIAPKLGDMPVLAEGTAQVTTREAQGKDAGTGAEVVKGLFLDVINGNGGEVPVIGQGNFPGISGPVLPGTAQAPAPRRN